MRIRAARPRSGLGCPGKESATPAPGPGAAREQRSNQTDKPCQSRPWELARCQDICASSWRVQACCLPPQTAASAAGRVDSSLLELSFPCPMCLQAARGHPLATGTAHMHGERVARGESSPGTLLGGAWCSIRCGDPFQYKRRHY